MEHLRTIGLLDSNGQPLNPRIERLLIQLLPRLRREFPSLQDEVGLTDIMEEAARRIRRREERGPIDRLHGYAWVTVRSIAMSRMRLGSSRLIQRTISPEAAEARLAVAPSRAGTAEDIERRLLLRELLATLSSEERLVCLWKQAGFSSQEIAAHRGRSVEAVDTMFSRAKQKLRATLGIDSNANAGRPRKSSTGKSDERQTA